MKLIKHPDDILKQKLEDFDFDQGINLEELEKNMISLMLESNGIGLSANQVGLDKRFFVMKLQDPNTPPFILINPKILWASEQQSEFEEGCLSFPELFIPVKRPSKIKVEYIDKYKNTCIIELNGIDSRCFQHELDHLDGICFTDKVSKLKLALALKKQRKNNGRTK